ncbi:unnamed protein product, partial [Hapterophycus canaliculatus]
FLFFSGGFIVNDGNANGNSKASPSPPPSATSLERPSFVSMGIRSGCAREKAATAGTLRSKNEAGASAASRLRGGSSWIPHPPVRVSHAEMEHQQAKARTGGGSSSNADPVSAHRPTDSCIRVAGGGGGDDSNHGAEFTVAKQRMVDDPSATATATDSFEDEDQDGSSGGGGGGGGGGGDVRFSPSFPRALPTTANGKVPLNKKFAWVP